MKGHVSNGKNTFPDKEAINFALTRIFASELFSGSHRLQGLLKYIVEETVAGRGQRLLGKTIAEDVYDRAPSDSGDPSNLVRVDARRLRQALSAYYNSSGADDPIRLHVDPGQYAVRFEHHKPVEATLHRHHAFWPYWTAIGILFVALISVVFLWLREPVPNRTLIGGDSVEMSIGEREALLYRSPATLEAVDLAVQARSLFFPAIDPVRLAATRDIFAKAIELDPHYFGGHAGLSQSVIFQSFMLAPGAQRDGLIQLGLNQAFVAVEQAPTAAWPHSALAWAEFARGNIDDARTSTGRARSIDATDLNALDFDTLIALYSGDFVHVIATADPKIYRGRDLRRHVFPVAFAAAKYNIGDYEGALASMRTAISAGGPIGQVSYAYLIAANLRAGHIKDAQSFLVEYRSAWPKSRLEEILRRLYVRDEDADRLFDALHELGWGGSAM